MLVSSNVENSSIDIRRAYLDEANARMSEGPFASLEVISSDSFSSDQTLLIFIATGSVASEIPLQSRKKNGIGMLSALKLTTAAPSAVPTAPAAAKSGNSRFPS